MIARNQVAPMILMVLVAVSGCSRPEPPSPSNSVTPSSIDIVPFGDRIAFLSDRDHPDHPGFAEIYLTTQDGNNQDRLSCDLNLQGAAVGSLSGLEGHIAWSPSERGFMYAMGALSRLNLSGDASTPITAGPWHIGLSADGRILAGSVSNQVTDGDIVVHRWDGSRPITITGETTRIELALPLDTPFYGPSVSADGSQVAFLSYGRVFVANIDGSSSVQLTPDIRASWPLSWSPDGKHIAFAVLNEGLPATSLKKISVDTGEIIDFSPDGSSPAWSPDGKQIAFTRSDNQLWVARSDGSDLRQLTFFGQNCCPMWITDPESLSPYVKTECAGVAFTPEP